MKLVQKIVSQSMAKKLMLGSVVVASLFNFAFATADAQGFSNLSAFQQSLNSNAGIAFNIAMIIATLAGLILIIKGLVHLKQNYTGSGQEKHLSKGIASLVFGTMLILTIPFSHLFVTTLGGNASTFNTGTTAIDFGSGSAPTPPPSS